jgi:glycosyltransferase involved in cell wall biosynthesis
VYSIMIPAFKSFELIGNCLRNILPLVDPRSEVIVGVNGPDLVLVSNIQQQFPNVVVLSFGDNLGPGGARMQMLSVARFDLVFSFDDDSYPLSRTFFTDALEYVDSNPKATIYTFNVFHRGESHPEELRKVVETKSFIGCACLYRKSLIPSNVIYVPVPCAYGMEEEDFSLQLEAYNAKILRVFGLTVFHDTCLIKHATMSINRFSILNCYLLVFLRFPVFLWPVGLLKVLSRVMWLIRNDRYAGVLGGMFGFFSYCYRYRSFRKPVTVRALWSKYLNS